MLTFPRSGSDLDASLSSSTLPWASRRHLSKNLQEMREQDVLKENILGKGNSQCKGPEVGLCHVCLRNMKEGGSV